MIRTCNRNNVRECEWGFVALESEDYAQNMIDASRCADQSQFWTIEKEVGELVPRFKDLSDPTDDFTVSRLTAQVRYRWEIGPLSDLFLVYTRGSNLPNQFDGEFGPLFRDAMKEPIVDVFTMKLRYRFGS